ncbi:serine racemase VanT catalytic subunit [Anaerosacchariphilus polymeriproducens]|uniref:Alanine racemase n=1 Tax=Anaerosacchariphilus polymeriproducens TaxID=1812858 RepID=A0A371AZ91_9FIRM|nr:serine racemase VanT catalytic subunit [Anaerosacchariphilus polymeriproducens]RDU24914.1 serine racemase VanT catalytic subunit [Anaerosacchariphilus polymeriproducens]
MRTKQNYGGLDVFRLLAAILVIAIHTSPLISISMDGDFFFTRILARVAVPFFFMVTGQFVITKFFLSKESAKDELLSYLKKVCILYGIAILIYIPIGIYAGHYQKLSLYDIVRIFLFDGTFYHLWYFPASLIGTTLIYVLSRFMSLQKITIIAGLLYCIGLLGDSYFGFIQNAPVIGSIYNWAFQIFSYTRNGLFMAPIFLLLGTWMSKIKWRFKKNTLVIGVTITFLGMTAEGFLLHSMNVQRHDSMYLMLIPTMVFLYQLLMRCNPIKLPGARLLSTWVYVLHPAMIVVTRIMSKSLNLSKLLVENSMIHFLVVVVLSLLSSFILVMVIGYSNKKQFLRGRAWIELNRNALVKNVKFLQSQLPKDCILMPAVKANAYGHGAVIISKELNAIGVRAFCVASVTEGVALRKSGVKGAILILGYTHPKQFYLLWRYHLLQTVVDYEYAVILNQYGKKLHVHLGVDTGMHRLGERSENIDRLCMIFEMPNLVIDGMFTHLSAADCMEPKDQIFTKRQVDNFYQLVESLRDIGYTIPKLHLQSSYGVLNYPQIGNDYARVGIALYGMLSTKEDTESWADSLSPVLSLKARVASVRKLYPNESAGYGMAFIAEREMIIATITIGYADGLPRSLSNGAGEVLINGKRAPIIGRICMDLAMIDVSRISHVKEGDTVVIIGKCENEVISAAQLAEQTGTITNEILSRLGDRLDRVMQ